MVFCDLYFSDYLKNDNSSKYWVYFSDINGQTFGQTNALLVNDADGNPITGDVLGRTDISFSFDYEGNTQGGRIPNTDVNITVVSIGLYMGRYTAVTGVLTNTNTSILLSPNRDWITPIVIEDLQYVYENSNILPKILTNNDLGGIIIQNGTINDSDDLIIFKNELETTVANINALGEIHGNTIIKNGGTPSEFLMGDGSVSVALISTSYTELIDLLNISGLTYGQHYLINDFQTIYEQPDFNSDGTPKLIIETLNGTIEPLIIEALSENTLSNIVISTIYENDKIIYDYTYNLTEINSTPAKGRIIERIDSNNNRTPFDSRNILFKRYESTNVSGAFDIIRDNGNTHENKTVFGTDCTNIFVDNINGIFELPNIIFGNNTNSIKIGTDFLNNTIGNNCSNIIFGNDISNIIFSDNNTNWDISDNIDFYNILLPLVSNELQPYSKFITKSGTNIMFKYIDGFGDTIIVDSWNNTGQSPIPFGPLTTELFNPTNKNLLSGITQTQVNNWDNTYTNQPTTEQKTNWTAGYTHIQDDIKHITTAERNLWNSNGYNQVDNNSTGGIITLDRQTITNLTTLWDNTLSFEIRLSAVVPGVFNEFIFIFQTGLSAPNITFTPPGISSFYWIPGIVLTPLANKVYMVSIFRRSDTMYIINYQ